MTRQRLWAVIAVPLLLLPLGLAPGPTTSRAASPKRTFTFKATFVGTVSINAVDLATRKATGRLASLGKAQLLAHDSKILLPDQSATVSQVTGTGSGAFSLGKKDRLLFVYMFSGDPVADGYFIMYGGAGKYLGASGRGTFHEVGSTSPGGTAPITDTFAGSLTIGG